MTLKTIKGVSEDKWSEFKSMAAKNNIPMGKLLENMVDAYSRKEAENFWNRILSGEKILSDKEAEGLENVVKSLRKERGFRV